jgi:murein L,D-transpeptidase YafK
MKKLLLLLAALLLASPLLAADMRIVVLKADRALEVYRDSALLHRFRIGLGNTPVGDKEKSGDGKTPEGNFYVCVKNPQSRFYLSLGISYPDSEDAARGLRAGLINQADHDQIVSAQKSGKTPPWNTRLGGEIFIHGNGSGSDWTLGCVALDDADMKTLFNLIEVGARVEIRP